MHASTPVFNPDTYQPRDLPSVTRLISRCYEQYGLRLNLDDECEQHLRDPGAYFRSHGGEFWVVRDSQGAVIATGALDLHQDRTPMVAELKTMYVDPTRQRQGLGRAMTKLVMQAARERGCAVMELWSDTRFTGAHAMYESLGFTRTGVRDVVDSNNSREFGFIRSL